MSETILNQIKVLLEVDLTEEIFDNQLLLYLNAGIQYLINNKIPINLITDTSTTDNWQTLGLKSGDEQIVLSWLHLYALQRFDRDLMETSRNATILWIDNEMQNLIYQLKVIYDNEVNNT